MNFKTAIRQITDNFCNAFYAKYLKGQWGYGAVGYKTVDEHIASMRKTLADWQDNYDCTNSLCAQSKIAELSIPCPCCPAGYYLLADEDGFVCTDTPGSAAGRTVPPEFCVANTTACCPNNFTYTPYPFWMITSSGVEMHNGGCVEFNQPDVTPLVVSTVTCQNSSVVEYAQLGGPCILNRPLNPHGKWRGRYRCIDVNHTIINTFTR